MAFAVRTVFFNTSNKRGDPLDSARSLISFQKPWLKMFRPAKTKRLYVSDLSAHSCYANRLCGATCGRDEPSVDNSWYATCGLVTILPPVGSNCIKMLCLTLCTVAAQSFSWHAKPPIADSGARGLPVYVHRYKFKLERFAIEHGINSSTSNCTCGIEFGHTHPVCNALSEMHPTGHTHGQKTAPFHRGKIKPLLFCKSENFATP